MTETITATHPGSGETHTINLGPFPYDRDTATDALMRLFRKFEANDGDVIVEGYGKTIEWTLSGSLVLLARRLTA